MNSDPGDILIDANGCLAERVRLGDQEVIYHYDDIPESDITTVNGIRCTNPLRTVIDFAPELSSADLERIVRDSLARKLFSVEDAMIRIGQNDMLNRPGAHLLRQALDSVG